MVYLDTLFEEDIEMQDALEDLETITDDSEDIIIASTEDRYNELENNTNHLFANDTEGVINDDGLTDEEEREANVLLLFDDEDDLIEDMAEDDDPAEM